MSSKPDPLKSDPNGHMIPGRDEMPALLRAARHERSGEILRRWVRGAAYWHLRGTLKFSHNDSIAIALSPDVAQAQIELVEA